MILFEEGVFGPIKSRRFGLSLGINLLPGNQKVCNFDCIYCECGLTKKPIGKVNYPKLEEIMIKLDQYFAKTKSGEKTVPDSITYAGNGEPMLHPDFAEITKRIHEWRNDHFPKTKIVLLSNGYRLFSEKNLGALQHIDQRVFKLDAGTEESFQYIDRPIGENHLSDIVKLYKKLQGKLIIQSMFLKGWKNDILWRNDTIENILSWIEKLKEIKPEKVLIYSLDREVPSPGLEALSQEELKKIARQVENTGIIAEFY